MKIAALISGGKDSIFALDRAIKEGHKPLCVIAIKSNNPESYMFHVPAIELTKLQAKAMNLPIIWRETEGKKEEELDDLKDALEEAKETYKIEGVVNGALASTYQKTRIESLCSDLELSSISPLWGISPMIQWRDMLKAKYKIILTGVAAEGLGKEWLGREIGEKEFLQLSNLHKTCYLCTGGEGGEFESLVLDCPLFKQRLRIVKKEAIWDEATESGELVVKEAKLVRK